MSEDQKPRPRFWPLLFISAFVLGGVLWVIWMSRAISQTRANRGENFFVPAATNGPLTAPGNAATNIPPAALPKK